MRFVSGTAIKPASLTSRTSFTLLPIWLASATVKLVRDVSDAGCPFLVNSSLPASQIRLASARFWQLIAKAKVIGFLFASVYCAKLTHAKNRADDCGNLF
jgi:hypothetical protein